MAVSVLQENKILSFDSRIVDFNIYVVDVKLNRYVH